MSGEPEPRRSVRATKGQHTKTFDQLENGPEPPKRRQTKKGTKKAAEKEDKHEEDEEIIRCICGATTQDDDDANEPWIACDKCGAWQHNVCVGMSVFTEDLTKDYFCEQCSPQDHKETLEAMKRGEKPWEDRRQKYEDEKKRKKGGKKGKGKRVSDHKERASPSATSTKPKTSSPPPEVKKEDSALEPPSRGKRKPQDHPQGPATKQRKVTESQHTPVYPKYSAPNDLPESIQKLEGTRRQAAMAVQKSLDSAIDQAEKKKLFSLPEGCAKKDLSERLAIEIERAFQDTHPSSSQNAAQLRTLVFSLKNNVELAVRVLNRSLPPPSFAVMSGEELATKELQRENAEMKARADKQSTLVTDDGPRVRRTHKGEEVIEPESFSVGMDDGPSQLRQQGIREAAETKAVGSGTSSRSSASASTGAAVGPGTEAASAENEKPAAARRTSSGPLRINTQQSQSPKPSDFDLGKVFSSVRSPSAPHQRKASTQIRSGGPGDDPDVDRLLQDDGNESPPYSPTEDIDPDVIWRGPLTMTNLADIPTIAKFVGGADLSKVRGIAWKDLIPPLLSVCGRIPEEKAVPYLCGLRYNNQVDLVITSLAPAHPNNETDRNQFAGVIEYFTGKKRYGVVGERKLGNVRDTYLIPVLEGSGPIPEPMQNIGDHLIPAVRAEPMLLLVFVVRDEKQHPLPMEQSAQQSQASAPSHATPVPPPKHPSISGPSWSPATPQGPFSNSSLAPPQYSQTPIPPPKIPGQPVPAVAPQPRPTPPVIAAQPSAPPPQSLNQDPNINAMRAAQAEGEMKARQVLGPLFGSSTVTFLLPHAARMKEGEWNAVRRCLERDPRARDDLQLLSKLLTEEGNARKNAPSPQTNTPSPGVVQTTLAAAANPVPEAAPAPQPKV
ncbi:putative SPOC domain-containing protein [Rosellinia necatrix]|uniref:Transcription factor BYE1 n=1 Tax=Rosellinia necatrix TaxID=77044 RepID=A0A1W2TM52_ROSNE|nr:putative SPOC domain-containing protein [Rosellinia necatrix]